MGTLAVWLLAGQVPVSPYTGEELRELKALSAETVRAYLEGEGLGFAKVAELNHYPGPRHVLELAEVLELSPVQREEVQRIFDLMHQDARRWGRELVETERRIEDRFAAGASSDHTLDIFVSYSAYLTGQIRATHLRAHLQTRARLSTDQVRRYDAHRGYQEHSRLGH